MHFKWGLKEWPKEWFSVKTSNVVMSNRVIDKSVDLKQTQIRILLWEGGSVGDPSWAPRLILQSKKYSTAYEMEIFWKYHQHTLHVIKQIQFYFKHA